MGCVTFIVSETTGPQYMCADMCHHVHRLVFIGGIQENGLCKDIAVGRAKARPTAIFLFESSSQFLGGTMHACQVAL